MDIVRSLWRYQNGIITSSHSTLWVCCQHDMAYPEVVDGGDSLQSWVVTLGVLNGKSQKANKGGPPFRGSGLTTHRNKTGRLQNVIARPSEWSGN